MKQFYFFTILLILKVTVSFSQSGFLNPSFGTGGKVVTATGDSSSVANAVAITPNNKIIIGGYSFTAGQPVATLVQYNADGTPDSTFGSAGKTNLSLPEADQRLAFTSIALQPDGKIVAVGDYSFSPLMARFNSNGNLDSSFGINGIAPVAIDSSEVYGGSLSKVIVKPDGKIVIGGTLYLFILDSAPFLTQYLSNGTIDSSFATNGRADVGISMYVPGIMINNINDITPTADGKLVVVVDEEPMGILGQNDFNLNRLLSDGNHDTTFGNGGFVRTDIGTMSGDDAYSAVVLPDSSIVAAGYSSASTGIALVKYHINGTLDSTFGINGKVITPVASDIVDINQILLLPDGKLIVSGYINSLSRNFVLVKYLPDGTLDSSFGTNGITTTDFSSTDDISYSSALQSDGKIVLAGSAGSSTSYNIALARYNNAIVYPLHLLSFTAINKSAVNLLQWQTAQEIQLVFHKVYFVSIFG